MSRLCEAGEGLAAGRGPARDGAGAAAPAPGRHGRPVAGRAPSGTGGNPASGASRKSGQGEALRPQGKPARGRSREKGRAAIAATSGDPGSPLGGPAPGVRPAGRRFFRVVVEVSLRPGALDAQGEAVRSALRALGYPGVAAVRVGKRIELDLAARDPGEAAEQARAMAERLLANPVLEVYRVRVEGGLDPAAAGVSAEHGADRGV
ncbi:phosphoribosylformylglycinamidine synthase, purS protein [Thermaerobacter subterraneus DSM 13965]|uniref:Phosphoribosylformylglycinamidine synthase subunit PurS n=1 Tax=Thermaerobacter subterraneus DSM 13965 TaxID=867903 RepID=K6Q3M2_9FIRM|nr:phosphoribosylformylglycinamidine synthase, purS protein [Thermaerobacter subterraneus DSM 13965]